MNMKLAILATVIGFTVVAVMLDRQHGVPVEDEAVNASVLMVPEQVALRSLYDDEMFAIESFRGRYVLLNFWASWCAPCLAEFPLLLQLAAEYPETLKVVAVSIDDQVADARSFIASLEKKRGEEMRQDNIHYVWDKDKRVTHDVFQTFRYPESILISPDGAMLHKFAGALNDVSFSLIRKTLD